jgi:hypothetical protein
MQKVCARTICSSLLAAAISLAFPTTGLAHGDWPDSPNKLWFENLQRPDNHKRPYQDKHTKSCCGPGDVVKTKFRVVPADSSYPQDAWFAWLREEWIRIPDDKIVPDYAPDGNAYLFVMYVGNKNDLSSHGFDEIICFVRPKGGL